MMIFDEFPTRQAAEDFAGHVQLTHGRKTWVCDSQAESDEVDIVPFALTPPIVLVDRNEEYSGEDSIELAVSEFSGQFAGT